MTMEQDIQRLAKQEELLQLDQFDAGTAWDLGTRLKAICEARGVSVTIEIRLTKETVFFYAMPGTAPSNADWARRKRNLVELLHTSSYAVGRARANGGSDTEAIMGLAARDYAAHGGSFPIRVRGMGCVGVVTVSGVPQREDHALVVEALAGVCGVPLSDVALD
jgi:uncharacterized protein (UPF0303 family)